jgi:predicted enzyme related to lactoylglutathione lyase
MLIGAHALMYSAKAEEMRSFFRDVLGFESVDAGRGWLIFGLPPAELAVHPREADEVADSSIELYLMCDNLASTMQELAARGVEFARPVTEARFGLLTAIRLPDGGELGLYEPRHPTALHSGK